MGLAQNGGGWRWRSLPAWLRRRPERTAGGPAILRMAVPLTLLVLFAIVVGSAFGVMLARQADDEIAIEQRQALIGAVDALKAVNTDLPLF